MQKERDDKLPRGVEVVAEAPSIPEKIERKEGVSVSPTAFTAQVTDDQGRALIQTPQGEELIIEIPKVEEELKALSKGKIIDSITWFARFWLRMIEKAIHFGKKIVIKK